MVSLINSVSDQPSFDFGKEEEVINHLSQVKRTIDDQIRAAIKDTGTFSDDLPGDPRYFSYEVESGTRTDSFGGRKEVAALSAFAGKGLRITAYNGFETDRVIIPNEIDGLPVISIGEKVFMNTTVSEVILPKSLKVILSRAFYGCLQLRHIDIPNTTEYLEAFCFASSGIEELAFPTNITEVPYGCCYGCKQLKSVTIGPQVITIGSGAFQECIRLQEISLPDSLLDIESMSFAETSIGTMIFPSSVKKVSKETFGGRDIRNKHVVCVFLGKGTVVDADYYESFAVVSLIYCLPGSKIQQMARERSIPIKPLSEFRMGN